MIKITRDIKSHIKETKKDLQYLKSKKRCGTYWGKILDYFVFNRMGQPAKQDYENPNKVNESIYPKSQSLGKYCKRFNWIHRFFKIMIIVPGMLIFDKLVGKRLDSKVEDEWYNKNLKILDDSWHEAMGVMEKHMCPTLSKSRSYELARKVMNTLVLNDSITREFMNALLHTITQNMQKAYQGKGDVYHVFYTDTVSYNPVYFTMVKAVMEQNKSPDKVQLEAMNKQERALYEDEQKIKLARAEIIKQKHLIYEQQKKAEKAKENKSDTPIPPTLPTGKKVESTFEPVEEKKK